VKNKALLFITSVHAIIYTVMLAVMVKNSTVPIHFNTQGQADSFGSKWIYLLFALLPPFLAFGHAFYHKLNQDNPNAKANQNLEEKTIPLIVTLFIVMGWALLPVIAAGKTTIGTTLPCWLAIAIGALLIYISNFYAKIKHNHTFGIKLPWTLKNETVWKKTHRLGGYTGVAGGLVILIGGALGLIMPNSAIWALAGLLIGIIIAIVPTVVYAYLLFHKIHPSKKNKINYPI